VSGTTTGQTIPIGTAQKIAIPTRSVNRKFGIQRSAALAEPVAPNPKLRFLLRALRDSVVNFFPRPARRTVFHRLLSNHHRFCTVYLPFFTVFTVYPVFLFATRACKQAVKPEENNKNTRAARAASVELCVDTFVA
jgi:hypothetical protein